MFWMVVPVVLVPCSKSSNVKLQLSGNPEERSVTFVEYTWKAESSAPLISSKLTNSISPLLQENSNGKRKRRYLYRFFIDIQLIITYST